MKRLSLTSLLLLLTIFSTVAQAPDTGGKSEQDLLTLMRQVQAQQAQIIDNQSKLDAKLAEVAEAVRLARLFSSRSR